MSITERQRTCTPARRRSVLACAGLLAGCSATVPVEATFPEPLVAPLPYRVGVYYDQSFLDYRHRERTLQGRTWTIQIGASQKALFDQVFHALFSQTMPMAYPTAAADSGLDGIIQPVVEEYRFLTPGQSGFAFFEVWISYRMRLYLPDGTLVASWPFTAYGKGPAALWRSGAAVRHATVHALRDAAAAVTIEFPQDPALRAWMLQRSQELDQSEDPFDVQTLRPAD